VLHGFGQLPLRGAMCEPSRNSPKKGYRTVIPSGPLILLTNWVFPEDVPTIEERTVADKTKPPTTQGFAQHHLRRRN
jgi:hypothetical protein